MIKNNLKNVYKYILDPNHSTKTALFFSAFSFVLMLLMGPIQDTGDDAITAWQLSRGIESYASFLSPYLSLPLNVLYQAIPIIPWWSVILIFCGFLLLFVGYRLILQRYMGFFRFLLCVIWFFAIWIAVVEKLNFTRSAIAYCICGILLLGEFSLCSDRSLKKRWYWLVLAFLLFIFGSMMRFQAALLLTPFLMIIPIYYEYCRSDFKLKAIINRNIFRLLFIFLIPVIFATGIFYSTNIYWNFHPEWKEYATFNAARSKVVDYVDDYPKWEDGETAYRDLGFKDEVDINLLFSSSFIADTDVYSLDTLKSLEDLKLKNETPIQRIYHTIEKVFTMIRDGRILLWFIFFAFVTWYYFGKKVLLPWCIYFGGAILILTYFSFSGRMMLRVWEPLILSALSFCLFLFAQFTSCQKRICYQVSYSNGRNEEDYSTQKRLGFSFSERPILIILLIIMLFVTNVVFPLSHLKVPNSAVDKDFNTAKIAEDINQDRDKIFLLSIPLIHHPPNPSFIGLWQPVPVDYIPNYFALSNWDALTPMNVEAMQSYGIKNPVKSLITMTNTYSNYDLNVLRFLQAHYGEDIRCSVVGEFSTGAPYVQYTSEIKNDDITKKSILPLKVMKSKLVSNRGIDAWEIKMKGQKEDFSFYDSFYCRLLINETWRTYRISLRNDNTLYGEFLEIAESPDVVLQSLQILGENKAGEYILLYET